MRPARQGDGDSAGRERDAFSEISRTDAVFHASDDTSLNVNERPDLRLEGARQPDHQRVAGAHSLWHDDIDLVHPCRDLARKNHLSGKRIYQDHGQY